MAVRALLFDLWGTLVDDSVLGDEPRNTTRARLAADALTRAGYEYDQDAVAAALREFGQRHGTVNREGRDLSPPERMELFLELLDPGLVRQMSHDHQRGVEDALTGAIRQHPPVPFAGAVDILDEARGRGLAVGLVSNTGWSLGYVLRDLLAEQGLLPYLQVLTFSDEACLVKPSAGMYLCTLDALGVDARDAVFIGDWPQTDVAGALAVGMWAVQVGDKQVDGIEPHARIETLQELFPALGRLGLLD